MSNVEPFVWIIADPRSPSEPKNMQVVEKSAYDELEKKLTTICGECAGLKMIADQISGQKVVLIAAKESAEAKLKVAIEIMHGIQQMAIGRRTSGADFLAHTGWGKRLDEFLAAATSAGADD